MIGKTIHRVVVLEAGGKVIMGSCIYGVTVFDGSLGPILPGICVNQ